MAKVASQEAKPDGLLLVPPAHELSFLRPLAVRRLWGVGAATADKLHALSHNIDRRRVSTGVRRRSVGAQRALGRSGSRMSSAEVDAVVLGLVDRITARMRAAGRSGRTVVLRLRFDDFSAATWRCRTCRTDRRVASYRTNLRTNRVATGHWTLRMRSTPAVLRPATC